MRRISDPLLFGLCLIATFCGLFAVFDAGYARSISSDKGVIPMEFQMQVVFTVVSIPLAFVLSGIRPEKWQRAAKPLWVATLVALAAVLVIGVAQNGARRWLGVGRFSLQPAEFAKLTGIVFFAACLAGREAWEKVRKPYGKRPGDWLDNVAVPKIKRIFPFLTVLVAAVLIEKEPDMGTAAVLVVTICLMFLPGRVSRTSLACVVALLGIGGLGMVAGQGYRIDRIRTHLQRWDKDVVDGTGYQTTQSEQGQADGGVTGVGIGRGRAKSFLPATTTDFIGATIGEETGLIGSLAVLGLLAAITARLAWLAGKAKSEFGALVLYGIAAWFGVQTCTNFMMANGFLPAIGIPLPFFSSGGSSLLALWAAVGVAQSALLPPLPKREKAQGRVPAQRAARVL